MELINAEALIEHLRKDPLFDLVERYGITGVIEAQPTVDAEPIRYGRWIYGEDRDGNDGYFCERCGEHVKWNYKTDDFNFIEKYKYCPYCGAKMDEGEHETD